MTSVTFICSEILLYLLPWFPQGMVLLLPKLKDYLLPIFNEKFELAYDFVIEQERAYVHRQAFEVLQQNPDAEVLTSASEFESQSESEPEPDLQILQFVPNPDKEYLDMDSPD